MKRNVCVYIYIQIYVKLKPLQVPLFSTSSFFFFFKIIFNDLLYQNLSILNPNIYNSPSLLVTFLSFFFFFFVFIIFLFFYYYIRIYQFRTPIQLYNSLFSLHVKVKVLNPKPLCSLIYASTPKPRSSPRHRHHGSLPLHRFLFAFPLSLNPAHQILCRQIILR